MGFGFVNFDTNEAAVTAMNAMNGTMLPQGKIMKISLARPAWKANIHSNVYVSGLPLSFTEEDILRVFKAYADKIENVRKLRDSRGIFRGIAVIRFDCEDISNVAMKCLDGLQLEGSLTPIQIKPWRPEFRPERIDSSFGSEGGLPQPTTSPSLSTIPDTYLPYTNSPVVCPTPPNTPYVGITTPSPTATLSNLFYESKNPNRRSASGRSDHSDGGDYCSSVGGGANTLNESSFSNSPTKVLNQTTITRLTSAASTTEGRIPPLVAATATRNTVASENWQDIWNQYVESQMKLFYPKSAADHPSVTITPSSVSVETKKALSDSSEIMSARATPSGAPSTVPSLFVFHLPPETTEQVLKSLFEPYGSIASVRVLPGKGYGFINYDQLQSAVSAVNGMNGYKIGNKHLKVEFKKPSFNKNGGLASIISGQTKELMISSS